MSHVLKLGIPYCEYILDKHFYYLDQASGYSQRDHKILFDTAKHSLKMIWNICKNLLKPKQISSTILKESWKNILGFQTVIYINIWQSCQ